MCLAWMLNLQVSLFCFFAALCWVLDCSRGLGALKLNSEQAGKRKIAMLELLHGAGSEWWMQNGKKDEKEWTKKGKELKDERMGDALDSSGSGVSNSLPVTDYSAPPKNN